MPIVVVILGIALIVGAGAYFLRPEEVVPPTVENEVVIPTPLPADNQVTPEEPAKVEEAVTVTEDTLPPPVVSPTPTEKPVTTITTADSTYKDGTYTVATEYTAPSRSVHTVDVTLTLADDVVTDVEVTFGGDKDVQGSNYNQGKFSDAYKTLVVGKTLDSISLSRVGGASLTTNSFNDALAEVKIKAQS